MSFDVGGAETLRRCMTDWASDMHLVPAGRTAALAEAVTAKRKGLFVEDGADLKEPRPR